MYVMALNVDAESHFDESGCNRLIAAHINKGLIMRQVKASAHEARRVTRGDTWRLPCADPQNL